MVEPQPDGNPIYLATSVVRRGRPGARKWANELPCEEDEENEKSGLARTKSSVHQPAILGYFPYQESEDFMIRVY
jgi:hypothetical protein